MNDPRPDRVMTCDAPGRCLQLVARAPRLIVPSRTFGLGEEWRPVRVMTTLHFCQPHADAGPVTAAELLTPKLKADIEAHARRARALGFAPDFHRATIDWVLVTTPEYRAFLQSLGMQRVFTA